MLQLNLLDVHKTYPGAQTPAVAGISFGIEAGEIFALLGPNGAGKTTSVKMAAGLVLPSSGVIEVNGIDIVKRRTQAVASIGAVLEGARNLYWRLSARENLRYFGRLRRAPARELDVRIDRLLELLDLSAHQDKEVRHFSRGMQQKLAVAAALIHDPTLLLLDEPILGLDVQSARVLEATIQQLAREQGKAILLTTHTLPLAEKLADRIFIIHQGREVACDRTETLLQRFDGHRDTVEIRLGSPLPSELAAALIQEFPGLTPAPASDGALMTWQGADQATVLQLLQRLDEQGLVIESCGRRQASLEEVFLTLTGGA